MRRLATCCLLLLALAGSAFAELRIIGEASVKPGKAIRLKVEGASEGSAVVWDFDEDNLDLEEAGDRLIGSGNPGTYRIKCRAIMLTKDGKTKVETARFTLTQEGQPKPPPPPVPPDPPAPPTPAGALRVLVVYEAADLPKMPAGQRAVLFDQKVRGALKDRTDKAGPDGRGWNIWDKDLDASGADKFWRDALKRARPKVPYVHLFKGEAAVYEGDLPATSEEMVNLVTKYAGP